MLGALGQSVEKPKEPQGDLVFVTNFDVVSCYVGPFSALDLLIRFVSSAQLKSENFVDDKITNFAKRNRVSLMELIIKKGFAKIANVRLLTGQGVRQIGVV